MNILLSVYELKVILEPFTVNSSSNLFGIEALMTILDIIIHFLPVVSLIILLIGFKQSRVFRKGAGLYLITSFLLLSIALFLDLLSQLDGIIFVSESLQMTFSDLYNILKTPLFLVASILLIFGFYNQYIVSEKLYRDLDKSNKLLNKQKEELSDFAHEMRHDLNNYIVNIAGYASILKKQLNDNDKKYAEKITDASQKMSQFLNRSLELAESGKTIDNRSINDFSEILENVKQMFSQENVEIEIEKEFSKIYCDNEKCYQLLKNIIENAIIHGLASKITIKHKKTTKNIEIHISNNGKPINQEVRKKMWNKGYSTKDNSGLGLTIVKKIINGHGWKISEDNKGKKVNFIIAIPLKDIA